MISYIFLDIAQISHGLMYEFLNHMNLGNHDRDFWLLFGVNDCTLLVDMRRAGAQNWQSAVRGIQCSSRLVTQ
jgi:hypothetical protein